jgi:predicted HTH transcriptional regulator
MPDYDEEYNDYGLDQYGECLAGEEEEKVARRKEAIQTFDDLMLRLYKEFATPETDKQASLTKVPILKLIEQDESQTVEFKETLECDTQQRGKNKDVLISSLKTIAAFLNSNSGGTLLVGVDDSGKIKGIERDLSLIKSGNTDKFEQKIRNCLKDRFKPQPIEKINISFEKLSEGTICRVDVLANEDIVHLDEQVYVRDGNVTQRLEGRALTYWIQQREN